MDLREDVQDCKDAIVAAYKQINLKCLSQSVQVQVCMADCLEESSSEDGKGGNDRGDCKRRCSDKADRLKVCERGYVSKQLNSYGIQDIVSLD